MSQIDSSHPQSSSSSSSTPPSEKTLTELCSNLTTKLTEYLIPTISAESQATHEAEDDGQEEEAEEEDPEDPAPAIREECAESSKCSKYKRHFDHCQERVLGGKGDKGEDCVEELFHLMHCVDECATPKIFSKLV